MKKQYLLALMCILCSLFLGYGQILTIVEKINGKEYSIKPNSSQIVDINSNLEIGISKKELIDKIRLAYPEFGNQLDLQERIDALELALTNQETILESLKQKTLNVADKKVFYSELKTFYNSLLQAGNEDLRNQASILYGEWSQKFGPRSSNPNSGLKKEVYILTNFNNHLNIAKKDLINFKASSFMVSMIASVYGDLGKNRVHIENFDTLREHDIYEVPRWVINLSEDQEKQLKELQKRADDYNNEALKYFDSFKGELLSKLPDLSCIEDLKKDIQNFIDTTPVQSGVERALKDDIQSFASEIDGLNELIDIVTKDISTWTIHTPFKIIENIKVLVNSVENINNTFVQFKQTADSFASIKAKVAALNNIFIVCYETLKKEITGLTEAIGILKNQQNRFKDSDEITVEVKKFTLNELPSTGYIRLKRSGPRENGDDLEIVLVLRLPKKDGSVDDNGLPKIERNEIIESHLLTMQLIGLRSETAVGIIMADSFNENGFTPVDDRRFLYAPTAALLLKVGSRNSKLYNDFLDFGFGLAVSTPDFNTDGTPEFGAGFTLTAFKDILSVGINYNVTLDTPYWSFGINLPFNLPGIPINKPN